MCMSLNSTHSFVLNVWYNIVDIWVTHYGLQRNVVISRLVISYLYIEFWSLLQWTKTLSKWVKRVGEEDLGKDDVCEIWVSDLNGGSCRVVFFLYLYFGGVRMWITAKGELAICLQRGGACLSSSALHCTELDCYSVSPLLNSKHRVQLLPRPFCDSTLPPQFRKETKKRVLTT